MKELVTDLSGTVFPLLFLNTKPSYESRGFTCQSVPQSVKYEIRAAMSVLIITTRPLCLTGMSMEDIVS